MDDDKFRLRETIVNNAEKQRTEVGARGAETRTEQLGRSGTGRDRSARIRPRYDSTEAIDQRAADEQGHRARVQGVAMNLLCCVGLLCCDGNP